MVGHEIKSRAAVTTIENSRIVDGTGTASYSIDLPNGGIAIVTNNVIQQGPNSENNAIISYGEETNQPQWANSELQIDHNTVINERASPRFVVNDGTETAAITNNDLFGLTSEQIGIGPNTQSNNTFLSAKPSVDSSHPWDASPPPPADTNPPPPADTSPPPPVDTNPPPPADTNPPPPADTNPPPPADTNPPPPADTNPPPPADTNPPPPADTNPPPPADTSPPPPADTNPPPPADTSPPPPADTSPPPPADTNPPPPADTSSTASQLDTNPPPPADTNPPPPADTPPADLVLKGGRGSDHLTGGDGNDQLDGGRGNDILVGHAGNDVINGGSGRDILMGGPGNDAINGNSGKDYLLLDGTMQDYTFAVNKGGVTITNAAGEVDTVKNVEVFHFSDGTNYLVGKQGLVQTSDQTINTFLAASGIDQSHLGPVSTAQAQQPPSNANAAPSNPSTTAPTSPGTIPPTTEHNHGWFAGSAASDQLTTIFGQALNQTGHTQGDKLLTGRPLWNAVDAASNVPTHTDTVLADLKQQLHDAFDHNGGATDTVDELAALLHPTHHE